MDIDCYELFSHSQKQIHWSNGKLLYWTKVQQRLLYQIFFLPQVERSVIISNKHGIYELPHELPNDLKFTILGN